MDVTFTNVLEGARQYFQGLPAATSSTADPSYSNQPAENNHHHIHQQQQRQHHMRPNEGEPNPEMPPSSAAYWPPQEASRPRDQTSMDAQRPQSTQHYQANYQQQHEQTQFQFSRPHSREAPSNQYQQRAQMATPPVSQSYHQLQNVGQNYYHPNQQQQQQQQQQRSYYQLQAKPTYKVASSQDNAYYKHLYTQQQQQYKPVENKQPQQQQQQENQSSYRATHNLPPIASLSLISYHSNRNNRDVIQTSSTKTRTLPTSSAMQQMGVPKPICASQQQQNTPQLYRESVQQQQQQQPQQQQQQQQHDYRHQYQNHQRLPVNQNQNYQYPTTTTTTQNYTQVIMTTSNASNYSVPVLPNQSSSGQQYYKPQQQHHASVNGRVPPPVVKPKRESPLDLSVKTVRTPADSTLDDVDPDRKFYPNRSTVASHNYPTYDVYANSFQRNLNSRSGQVQSATAPKVEFHPNFNQYRQPKPAPATQQRPAYAGTTSRYPTVTVPSAAHVNSYIQAGVQQKPRENLPRIEFPPAGHGHKTSALYPVPTHDPQKKRPADTAPAMIPNKITKVDTWRQSIDQEIEHRLSSYQQQQQAKNKQLMVNGGYNNQERPKEVYQYQNRQQYQYNQYHNQTYVPSAGAHQYPGYSYPQQNMYNTQVGGNKNNNLGGADKRVLSLLRNSLEIKGAKEAQKKLEQEQLNRKSRLDVQHPSTDVTAPLQPKPGFINRHNVSPFTPTNLPDNNNSLMYKLHIPKAIDSVNFESESGKFLGHDKQLEDSQVLFGNHVNPNGDLDGLAALVAARIRTKAELKQVSSSNNMDKDAGLGGNGVSPPKLMKERHGFPPRRRLFSRNEDEVGNVMSVPMRDKTGLRSSSETSVFDFPDTDSEGEMPVLERQTLEDMRRDRRSSTKPNDVKTLDSPRAESPDDMFAQACESFVEQLKCGSGKKRGRRKKIEADVLAKLETVTKERPLKEESTNLDDDDSDVPLINCKNKLVEEKHTKQEEDEEEVKGETKEIPSVVPRPAKKPLFGDGSHFYPGWEEEVYRYKKSLRMPPSLIQVTRPPQYHRLSTSLPDLDPLGGNKIKTENLDSDTESNHSFNLFSNKNYDSEGSSSIKSLPNSRESSILDKLLEKYGGRKKRKHKRKEDAPKVTPKSEKVVELLPTPARDAVAEDDDHKTPDFRNNFKDVFLAKRKESRVPKPRLTIKEVFGEDRPASAPPVTCVNHIKIKEEIPDDAVILSSLIKKESDDFANTRQVLKNRLLNRGRKDGGNLLKTLVGKKIKTELLEDDDSKSETPSIDGDESGLSGRKRSKFRSIRRKFSSGFDYIRKKKKHVKKDNQENEVKPKRRGPSLAKSNPGSVQDIQKEIKGWVLNKGIGETILHRSARLGYTDITAYCLDKMECSPSPKDNAGYTPLHEASTKGHLGIAKMLLMYGANVSESARGGIRPLHEAVENGYVEVVRLLLSYGADPMLATYSGMTPLGLASDDATVKLLKTHIDDVEGKPGSPWDFAGPASCFDLKETGFDVLADEPLPDPPSDEEDLEFEVSDSVLPNLYTLRGEPSNDRWILLQDLSSMLKMKSRDALLRQICPSSTSQVNYKSVLRELKMSDFLEQAHCCQFLNIGEKVNTRASKIALVKYTDKVRELLSVERVTISVR